MSTRQTCASCGSTKLTWSHASHTESDVPDGRLYVKETESRFYLECDDCSVTARTISADQVVILLNDFQVLTSKWSDD